MGYLLAAYSITVATLLAYAIRLLRERARLAHGQK